MQREKESKISQTTKRIKKRQTDNKNTRTTEERTETRCLVETPVTREKRM